MKSFLRKLTALIAACTMILSISFPAMAGGESPFMDMTPGDYLMDWVNIYVPNPGNEVGVESTSRLYGPTVDANGFLRLEQGAPVTFYYEQTMPYGYNPTHGFRAQLQAGYYELSGHRDYVIPIDGKTTFALPTENAEVSVKISFNNVYLSSWLSLKDDGSAYGPTMQLDGKITIEVTTMVDGYFTIPKSTKQLTYENIQEHETELVAILNEHTEATRGGSNSGVIFDTPQELTYRIDLSGDMIGFGTNYYETALNIGFCVTGSHDYTVSFQGETYKTIVRDESNGGVDFNTYSMNCFLTVEAMDWSLSPFIGMGEDPDAMAPDDSTVTLAQAATVTVGAGAAALGGSALVSVLGDAVGSSASNLIIPDPSVINLTESSPSVQTAAASDLPEANLPSDKKKKKLGDVDEKDEAEETTDIPDLPEEDSPEVSMSLYAPGSDLLNIKGGAADLTINIEGGEGYTWNYLPAIIAPGAAKAIIPLVTGRTNLATLVLNLTGANTEERHHTVFVNVIAWAMTPDGKLLKASGSKEMKLHTPGIEAKRDKDGSITVTAYSDTTLKGYAEIRKLSAEEYILEVMEDETVTIHANDVKLGMTSIKK